jgi:hypothetical protein
VKVEMTPAQRRDVAHRRDGVRRRLQGIFLEADVPELWEALNVELDEYPPEVQVLALVLSLNASLGVAAPRARSVALKVLSGLTPASREQLTELCRVLAVDLVDA